MVGARKMNTPWKAAALLGLLLTTALVSCGDGQGTSKIVVDSTADTDARDETVTLREAILLASGGLAVADLSPGEADNVGKRVGRDSSDTIIFDPSVFPPSGGGTISLTAALPPLSTGTDTIDGLQASVTIDGGNQSFECIVIGSSDNAVKGLQIKGCLVAVMIQASAAKNAIGGPGPGEGNVISGNDEGIVIGGAGADGNTVRGNLIGVDATGSSPLSNRNGVHIHAEARANVIGGGNPDDRNIISGNKGVGITIRGSANLVQGNYIGTDKNGMAAIPNGMEGIWIAPDAQDNVVGGSTAGERNVISGNDLFGLSISGAGATGNIVKGNYIGIDASGGAALANRHGLVLDLGAQENIIGGITAGEANVISANGTGVLIRGPETNGNVIIGNYIGTDASGAQPIGNALGVWLLRGAQHNIIGGISAGEGNVISASALAGVQVEGQETVANTIRGNSIFSNQGKAIQHTDGGNRGLAAPTLTGLSPLTGSACAACTVDIYSDAADEGKAYEGSVVADADGHFVFESRPSGPNVAATATDSEGNTSPFSPAMIVQSP